MKSIFSIPELVATVFRYDSDMDVDFSTLNKVSVFFGIIIYIVNFKNVDNLAVVLFTYVIGTMLVLLPFFFNRVYDRKKHAYRILVILALVLTAYALMGINEGTSNYWSVMAVFVVMVQFGMPIGLVWGTYYFVLCIVFFWTPIKDILPYAYTDEYAFSFPFIFFVSFAGSFILNLFYKKGLIDQEKQDEQLKKELEEALAETDDAMIESVRIVSQVIDEKDMYTKEHSLRVARYSKLIAQKYGLGDDLKQMRSIYNAALLHDIGKIAISDSILKKGKGLSDEEYQIMKNHTIYGEEILRELTFLPNVYYGAKYHHEHMDGTGYPEGVKGRDIPIEARIICAADALDAMNSKRVYRDACSKEYILDAFRNDNGAQFDRKIAKIVCQLILEGKIAIVADENKDA